MEDDRRTDGGLALNRQKDLRYTILHVLKGFSIYGLESWELNGDGLLLSPF